ncbi:CMT1A duplicated region transcript 1 protein [Scleropages formosus]|uniref:CMT1A duplicated region transcript 1 protein n=1 Tax=Scleropages formosus TaxID=113540 RepID=UPI0010FA8A67|nr:CMT1A duplicated region transcript 1 protein [Scleropages formosus]
MDLCEFLTASAHELRCRGRDGNLFPCGRCQPCALHSQISRTMQWFLRAGDELRRHFLIGILLRCQGTDILKDVERLLRVTHCKDFTYTRSRQKPSLQEDSTTWSSSRALDGELLRNTILETWDWFSGSKQWTKEVYVLRLLQLCNTELLHALGNLTNVLLRRERKDFLLGDVSDVEDETFSIPESHYSFKSDNHPELDLLICASSSYGALDQGWDLKPKDVTLETIEVQDPGLQNEAKKDDSSTTGGETGSLCCEDLALMVTPRSSKALSGVSRCKDFIRGLPVHLAKRILGLLDKAALLSCLYVSQHWRCLAKEVWVDWEFKRVLENRAVIAQRSSSSRPNPAYANIQEVLVPTEDEEEHLQFGEHAFNPRRERGFEKAYAGINTKVVKMEERNVYCGPYNLLLLLDRKVPQRVVDYGGGQLLAVGSKDRLVQLLEVDTAREASPAMRGHTGSIRAVLLREERDLLISASFDLSIRCWNLKTKACVMLFRGHSGTVTCLGLHGDSLVSGAKDCKVKVWNLVTGKCYEKLKFQHSDPILCVKTDGNVVLSSCQKGQVKMWSLKSAMLIKVFDGHEGPVRCLFFNQWHVLSGGADGCVIAWSTSCDFHKSLATYQHPKEVLALEFLFLRVITGCSDGKVRIFNFLTGNCLRVIKASSPLSPVLSLHAHSNKVVINTKSSVVLLRFAEVHWDYSLESDRTLVGEPARDLPKNSSSGFRKHPYPYVRAERMALLASSNRKLYHRTSQEAERPALSHHARSLSTASMRRAQKAQQESLRPATWSELLKYRRSRAYIDLQPEFLGEPPSALSPGRPVCRRSSSAPCGADQMGSAARRLPVKDRDRTSVSVSCSERVVSNRIRRREPHHSITPEDVLPAVNSSQQLQRTDEGNYNMENTWGPLTPPGNKDLGGRLPLPRKQGLPAALSRAWTSSGTGKVVHQVGAFTTTSEQGGNPPLPMILRIPPRGGAPTRSVTFPTSGV